jgi:hypothetical protein
VGFWKNILVGAPALPALQSPWAPTDSLVTFTATELYGALADSGAVSRDIALRVPGIKRAHGIHCGIVAGLKWQEMDNDTPAATQPNWLTTSASGVSPRARMFGIVSDLFMNGWACLSFTEDRTDALHIPYGLWKVEAGEVVVDGNVEAAYRAKPILIPLGYGENGILVDGVDSVRSARLIERIWNERIENPAPATNLHISDPAYDQMTAAEKIKIVDEWNANRRRAGGQTAVTQSFLDVQGLGETSADLFEKGRNASRLDLANHCAVPASIIEGAKDGGGGDINYSNETGARNELWDFGTSKFANAIEARLSLDDVCAPGRSIRADLSGLMAVPTQNMTATSQD